MYNCYIDSFSIIMKASSSVMGMVLQKWDQNISPCCLPSLPARGVASITGSTQARAVLTCSFWNAREASGCCPGYISSPNLSPLPTHLAQLSLLTRDPDTLLSKAKHLPSVTMAPSKNSESEEKIKQTMKKLAVLAEDPRCKCESGEKKVRILPFRSSQRLY